MKFQKKEKKRNDPNNKRIRTVKLDNTSEEPVAKKAKKNPRKMDKDQKKEEKENKAFDKLVSQYRNKIVSNQQVIKKWFD